MRLLLVALLLVICLPSAVQALSPLQAAELSIAQADHEIVYIFNAAGRQVARIEGQRYSTQISIKPGWRNGTLTHNHPGDSLSPPSISDLDAARAIDLKELRAVSWHGHMVICRVWKIGHWPRFNVTLLHAQVLFLIDYKPISEQERAYRAYMTGLSKVLKFGFECKG